MPKPETEKEQLRLLARAAIVQANADMGKAVDLLDKNITQKNVASLERELTGAYRNIALRALLATHYNELRAEGKIRQQPNPYVRITDYDKTTEKPKSWSKEHIQKVKERTERERDLFETHLVNGIRLGDCTREQLLDKADHDERNATFLRTLAHPLPPGGILRDYLKPDDATKAKQHADTVPLRSLFDDDPVWQKVWPWLMKGLKEKDLTEAEEMAKVLRDLNPEPHTPQSILLDTLARAISEYEDRHPV